MSDWKQIAPAVLGGGLGLWMADGAAGLTGGLAAFSWAMAVGAFAGVLTGSAAKGLLVVANAASSAVRGRPLMSPATTNSVAGGIGILVATATIFYMSPYLALAAAAVVGGTLLYRAVTSHRESTPRASRPVVVMGTAAALALAAPLVGAAPSGVPASAGSAAARSAFVPRIQTSPAIAATSPGSASPTGGSVVAPAALDLVAESGIGAPALASSPGAIAALAEASARAKGE